MESAEGDMIMSMVMQELKNKDTRTRAVRVFLLYAQCFHYKFPKSCDNWWLKNVFVPEHIE